MKVIATATGYDGLEVRNEGDEFDFKIDPKVHGTEAWPTWFEPAEKTGKGKDAKDPANLA